MDREEANRAVRDLQEQQRDILVAIALADEAQAERRKALADVRARLSGVAIGVALAAPAAEANASG